MSSDPDRDELKRLQVANERLRKQVYLLIQTEQRLARTSRELESQLSRIGALNTFALEAAGGSDEGAVLQKALDLMLAMYPYEQALAFSARPGGALVAVAARSVEGRAGSSARELVHGTVSGATAHDLPVGPVFVRREEGPPREELAPLLSCGDRIFGDGGAPCPADRALVMPLRVPGQLAAALLLRRVDRRMSQSQRLPDDGGLPFLHLVSTHIEGALEAVSLRQRMRTVVESLPGGIAVIQDGKLRYASEGLARLLHHTDTALQDAPLSVLTGDDGIAPAVDAVSNGRAATRLLQQPLRTAEGSTLVAQVTLSPIELEGSAAVLLIAEDHAERERMRAQLVQADRLASVGTLAAGVAHEINNPLAYVMANAERLAQRHGDDPRVRDAAEAILEGVRRVRDITQDLKTFARVEEEQLRLVEVSTILQRVLAMAEREIRYRATVETRFEPGLCVRASEGRLAQVFLNLVINAAHAIDEGHVARNRILVMTRAHGDDVCIEVRDSGRGMDAGTLERIFEPFVSTKPSAQGLGLGLSICHNIVRAYGGRIEVHSELGKGSRFIVRLPRATGEPETDTPISHRPTPLPHTPEARRVLLVDDERAITAVLRDALTPVYEVDIAETGRDALQRLRARRYDAIVCDLMMPGMSGMELHGHVEREWPDLARRTVFITGGTFTPRASEFLNARREQVLEKPFGIEELAEALERVLG